MVVPPDRRDDFLKIDSRNGIEEISKRRGGKKYNPEENKRKNEEIKSRGIDSQFRSAASLIKSKRLHDAEQAYVIVKLDPNATPSKRTNMINNISGQIHAYLNEANNIALFSIPMDVIDNYMEKELPLNILEPILGIKQLEKNDVIDDSLLNGEKKEIIIHLIPKLLEEKNNFYLDEILNYLKEINVEIILDVNEFSDMLFVKSDISGMEKLVEDSNFVFKIEPIPSGSVNENDDEIEGAPEDIELELESDFLETLPIITVFDTGCNDIPPLKSVLEDRDYYYILDNPDDSNQNNGHGTPISYLAAFGEGNIIPRAKINSFKIFAPIYNRFALPALMVGINKYPIEESRIYTSSIVYYDQNSIIYSKLNNEIQEKNICFVSSAGNTVLTRANVSQYPTYIFKNEVDYPSKLPNVIGVGGITKKSKTGSIAKSDELSPITKCGAKIPGIFSIKKPEVVAHGGNICSNGDKTSIGVESYNKSAIKTDIFLGTSFAAPLIAGIMAEIEKKYGSDIQNSETLKALLVLMCKNRNKPGYGYGEPESILDADKNRAVIFSEGSISLSDFTQPSVEYRESSNIILPVPAGVGRLDMILVHSDDYKSTLPRLNTYLKVKAWKRGRENSPVPPLVDVNSEKTNVKLYSWSYARKSMQADWRFQIIPDTTSFIDYELRKNINVRYGAAILLSSRANRLTSLSEDVQKEVRIWSPP